MHKPNIIVNIIQASKTSLFWNKVIAIIMSIIAIELLIIINGDDDSEAIPVYVVGGQIDVSGSVDVENVVDIEGTVDVMNTVNVRGFVGTY